MADRYRDILVVDLLGGLGDLCMVLPSVHALRARNPDAALRVLTHAPGDELLRSDPAVTEVLRAPKGGERAAVVAELDRRRPDLVVSTTRYDGIAEEIESRGMRSVTNLWRHPPPDEPVGRRYLAILAEEGLVDAAYRPPSIHLTPAELASGRRALARLTPAPDVIKATFTPSDGSKATFMPPDGRKATLLTSGPGGGPVVLVPGAGMAVKRWPHWAAFVAALPEPPLVVDDGSAVIGGTRPVPPTDLRGLAAFFAAVARRGGVVVGSDTGPVRVAAAVGARTVGLFGPTAAARYGLDPPAVDIQGLPGCPHRRPTAITEQVCWWAARCPLSDDGPACMADIAPAAVLAAVAG